MMVLGWKISSHDHLEAYKHLIVFMEKELWDVR